MDKTYTHVWRKYLPAIKQFIKKDLSASESFQVDKLDFGVGNRVRAGYSFSIRIRNGRCESFPSGSVVGDNLFELMDSDAACKAILREISIKISMNDDFVLKFKSY